jgi:3-oxoacyl-[acyl-carrier protein] reductase
VILVTGSASGLGHALKDELTLGHGNHNVIGYDVREGNDVRWPAEWLKDIPHVDVLINCAGVNSGSWFENVSDNDLTRLMEINAFGPVKMTQALLPQLKKSKGTVINIVSNAAKVPMTCSLAYNMSKAAALMATKQMAHELTPSYGITVFAVSPNKLADTEMSKQIEAQTIRLRGWTPEYARDYQLKALKHGKETPPKAIARQLSELISTGDMQYLSGCNLQFGL